MKKLREVSFKTILSLVWAVFTVTLMSWWIYLFVKHAEIFLQPFQRMFFLEGIVLLFAIVSGGIALLFLSIRDQRRHQQIRVFFSQFSHDLRTSISRLRLQSEILLEELDGIEKKGLTELTKNINLLDLQLENSLWMSRLEDIHPHLEICRLSELIAHLKSEFPDLQISIQNEQRFLADKRFTVSILRNLFHNSILHGKATEIQINPRQDGEFIEIVFTDNGSGSSLINQLAKSPLESLQSKGSGIGLFLVGRLMKLQNGSLTFSQGKQGQQGLSAHLRFSAGGLK